MAVNGKENLALTALTRFGLGARPGEIAKIAGDPRGFVLEQLQQSSLPPVKGVLSFDQGQNVRVKLHDREMRDDKSRSAEVDAAKSAARDARFDNTVMVVGHYASSQQGFLDRLAMFWSNHLCVSFRGSQIVFAGSYENDVIRAHTLGHFEEMLLASARHPAMLFYLNNNRSIGPKSPDGIRTGKGLNENYAREVLELHTLGVDGGYTQQDVIAAAKALTGWTITPFRNGTAEAGRYTFVANRHEPGPQTILNKTYAEEGEDQGEKALRDFAHHPATARHLAVKVVRTFVSPKQNNQLVDKLAANFTKTGGDLREFARTLVTSDESWIEERESFLPPLDFVVAAARALPGDEPPVQLTASIRQLGQPIYLPPSPAGFPTDNAYWLGAEGVKKRLEFVNRFAQKAKSESNINDFAHDLLGSAINPETKQMIARAESKTQGLTLLLMSADFQRR